MKNEYKISRTRFPADIIDFVDSWNLPMSARFHHNEDGTFVLRAHTFDYACAMKLVKAAQRQFENAKLVREIQRKAADRLAALA